MKKITLEDYARLSSKKTNKPCSVAKGDLIKIYCDKEEYEHIGIVTEAYKDKMCVLIGLKEYWWTTHVKCEVLTYNNST